MKRIPNEVFSLKNDDSQKWVKLSKILLEEFRSESFKKALAKVLCSTIPKFSEHEARHKRYPYHVEELINVEEFHFRYFVQVIAHNKKEIASPKLYICGVMSYYTFWIQEDKATHEIKIDVFSPHVFEQYAQRSYRLPGDLEMPEEWEYTKQRLGADKFKEDEFFNLFLLAFKFFARNKTYIKTSKKEAYSLEEQILVKNKDRKEWLVTLWPDGLTYCKSFNSECDDDFPITLHTTYLPYTGNPACHSEEEPFLDIKQTESIAEDFAQLDQKASDEFPTQYNDRPVFDTISKPFIKNALKACQASDKLYQNCRNFIRDISIFILTNKEKLEFNEEYKSPKRFSLEEIQKAKEIVAKHKHFTTSNTENLKEVFFAFVCITNCLWWHIQKVSKLNEIITTTDSPNSLLYRKQMTSVIIEMAELYQLLYDFFPEGQLSNNKKFS